MTKQEAAQKKVEIAIDKIIDVTDMGFACDLTERVLELLRQLESKVSQ